MSAQIPTQDDRETWLNLAKVIGALVVLAVALLGIVAAIA